MLNKQAIAKSGSEKLRDKIKKIKDGDVDDDKLSAPDKSLGDHGVYFFNDDVNSGSVGDAIRFILEANLDPDCHWDHITMIVNSPGGYCTDGFALIDIMMGSRIPIRTVGIGMIASMGLQIFISGEKGHRTLTPNCMILSHQYAGGSWGKEHELVAAQDEFDALTEMVLRHYKRTTGLSLEEIREHLLPPHDVWLTATKAKALGVCDNVKDIKPIHLKNKVIKKTAKTATTKKPSKTTKKTVKKATKKKK